MAYTPEQIRQWIVNKLDTSVEPNWADQNDVSLYRGLHIKHDHQLLDLKAMYKSKVPRIVQIYQDNLEEVTRYIKNFDIPAAELKDELAGVENKVRRLADKWLAVKREIEGREKGYFDRLPVGTTYYIDLDNGSDVSPHDGLKVGNFTADAGTGETTLIETSELGRTTNDDWNGAYLYNVTRGIGVLITDSAYDGGEWTLTHPTITGQVEGDTYFIIDAWKTIEQYTTVTERSPGDIAYVRANTDEIPAATIAFDEDGNKDARISIIGCDSVVNDPWNDGSDIKPAIDMNGNAYYLNYDYDLFWYTQRLKIHNGSGVTLLHSRTNNYFEDLNVEDNTGNYCVRTQELGTVYFKNCVFKNSNTACAYSYVTNVRYDGCTFDSGANVTNYGIQARQTYFEAIDCLFSQSSALNTADIYLELVAVGRGRNNTFGATPIIFGGYPYGCIFFSEDDDAVYRAGKIYPRPGLVTKDTGIKTGSANFSHKMEPDSDCGLYEPLTLHGDGLMEPPFTVDGIASEEITCTIEIRSLGTWGTYPTNAELYIEASYYDSGADAGRSTVKSTQVLSHASNWVEFTVTMTPLRDGPIYINVYLKKYEDAGDGCYVNGEATT